MISKEILRRSSEFLRLTLKTSSVIFFLVSCSTANHKETSDVVVDKQTTRQLESDLLIQSRGKLFKARSYIYWVKDLFVRIEITTTLDLPLASVLIQPNKIEYLIVKRKTFYSGEPNPHALDPVFPLNVDFQSLQDILTQNDVRGFECKKTEEEKYCTGGSKQDPLVAKWYGKNAAGPWSSYYRKQTIELPARQTELKFIHKSTAEIDAETQKRMSALSIPADFLSKPVPTTKVSTDL